MDNTNLAHALILLVTFVAWATFWITALMSILRRPRIPSFERGVWTVIVIVLPFIGPLAWFVWGRSRSRHPAPQA